MARHRMCSSFFCLNVCISIFFFLGGGGGGGGGSEKRIFFRYEDFVDIFLGVVTKLDYI